MVFALETYCPASDGFSAARIEEEVVVTEDGPGVLTRFPAQDLFVARPVLSTPGSGGRGPCCSPKAVFSILPARSEPGTSTVSSVPPAEWRKDASHSDPAALSDVPGLVPVAVVVALITAGVNI